MKKRTSRVSRRVVSLLMSLVLTLTLVTPAAFATEVVDCSGTPIVEGNANPADVNTSEDAEGKNDVDKNTEDGKDEQPADTGDEDKNPDEGDGGDANKPAGDSKGEAPDGENKDEENKDEQPTEDENDGEDNISLLNDENGAGVWDGSVAEQFAGGDGSKDSPYQISNGAELAYLAKLVNDGNDFSKKTITLKADINLNTDDVPASGNEWTPIGNSDNVFNGIFDGDGHTISGLYINVTGNYSSAKKGRLYQGLFGYVEDGTVQNLIVTGSVTVKNERTANVSYIGGIVGYNDSGIVQNCGFYGIVSAKKKDAKDCTKDNGGVVGKGRATNCWYFCMDIENASLLGVCGGYANKCYQNVSENASGDFIGGTLNSFGAILQLNAAGTNMWKPGKAHPEFLQDSEKLVVLQPLFSDTTAVVQVNGSSEGAVVTNNEPIVLTGEDAYYRVGENGEWAKIDSKASINLDGADQVVTIYYASAEELQSAEWYDPTADEFVLTTAGQLAYLAQLVNGGTSFAGKTIKLGGNIEISKTWTAPIGTDQSKSFKGTFDGEGHVISVKDGTTFCGLFGYNDGTIRNVIVTGTVDASSATDTNVGGIAGTSRKTLQNCGFYGRFENTDGKTIRGVANGAGTGVENCWFYNTGENSVDVAGNQWNKPKSSYVNRGENINGGELVSEDFAAVVAKKLNDALADNWFPWVTQEGYDYPIMLIEGTLVNVTSYDGADDTVVTIGNSGTASAVVTENTVTLKLADSYTGETVYVISDSAEEVVIDGENATPRLTSESRTCVYTLPDGKRFVKLYYGTEGMLNADDSWYDADATEMTIVSAKQLRTFAGMVNGGTDFAGKTIRLGATIVLSGEWTPIGTAEHPFKGTFDGSIKISDNNYEYYAVSGLDVNGTIPYAGLFGVVDGGTIQNLSVTGSVSSEAKDAHVGGIVGWLKAEGAVKTCVFIGSVKAAGENAVRGGLVGKVESTASVSDGYCYSYNSAEDVKPVGEGKYTKCFYLAAESTCGKQDDNGARTEQEFKVGRVAWELLGENEQFTDVNRKPHWAQENGMPVIASHESFYFLYEVELVKRSGPEALSVIMQANGTNALLDGDTQRVYVAGANEITIDSDVIGDDYTVTYSPKDPRMGINTYNWGMTAAPNNTFYYTISTNTNEDIGWYIGNEGASEYTLKTMAQLFGFAALVNGTAKRTDGTLVDSVNFSGKTINLADDIDVSGYEWIPIGYSDGYTPTAFAGTFDGKGHTVTLALDTIGQSYVGFFGYVTGTVRNLTVDGGVKADGTGSAVGYAAGVVAYLDGGTVEMCVNKANVTTNTCGYTAGIVGGSNNGVVKNCRNTGAITSSFGDPNGYAAGIANNAASVTQCWNEGDIELKTVEGKSANSRVAGVAAGASVLNSANFGKVSGPAWAETGVSIGGVGTASVANSYNMGGVTGAEGQTYGISGGKVTNSYYVDIGGETGSYVKNSDGTTDADKPQSITITEGDDKKVYKVGNVELVEVLNENFGSISRALQWLNKQDEPWNPVHIQRWDGSNEPGVAGTATLAYDPNGATIGTRLTETQMIKNGRSAATFTIRTDDALGYKHKNGTFLGWSKEPSAAQVEYQAGATISVEKDTTITLYAVWDKIWEGDGSATEPYQISNKNQLIVLATQVNDKGFDYKGEHFVLLGDIDLAGIPWTPIGDTRSVFSGQLNGNEHTISNLKVSTSESYAGLFGLVKGAAIESLTLENGEVTCERGGTSFCGGLAGGGTLTATKVCLVNVTVEGHHYTGGILGYGGGSMTDCSNVGGVVKGKYAGGMAGRGNTNGAFEFIRCTNSARIEGEAYAGGISGDHRGEGNIFENCRNEGSVNGGIASGIAIYGQSFTACTNAGEVKGKSGMACGITNSASYVKMCGNTGDVYGSTSSGITWHAIEIENCYNTGKVSATAGNAAAYGIAQSVRWSIKNSFTYNVDTQVPLVSNIKGGTYGDKNEVTNSYYLASSATAVNSAGEYATLTDFASGKVAWGVGGKGEGSQGGTGQDAQLGWWKQDKDDKYPTLLATPDMSKRYYRTDVDCGTGGEVELTRNASSAVKELSSKEAVYGPAGTSVTIKATPKDNTFGLKSLTWTHNGQTNVLPTKGTTNIVMPAESNVTIHAEFASVGPGGNGGYYYGGSGDGTGTGDKDDEGLQDGLNMDVEYNIKGLVLGAYAEWGSNGGNKSFQKWLEENPNVVRALLTNSLDNMATAAVGKKTDEAKDLAALLLASLNEHTGVDSKDGDTIAKALQKYIGSGSEEVFSAWLTAGGGMASGTYESIYGQYASSLAALTDRLYSKWEASGTSMTFPVWLDSQQVSMDSLSENADEPDTDTANDPQTSDAPDDVPDGQDTEGGASGNSVWEVIGTVVRENPIIVWSIVAVIAALIIVGAVRRYHKVKRDERDEK